MKMSAETKKMFDDFYNLTVEKASDEEVKFILHTVYRAATAKNREKFNYNNPNLNEENAKFMENFTTDFLNKATDDEAIYIIEGIKAIIKTLVEHPKEVSKFVAEKKKEALANAKKED